MRNIFTFPLHFVLSLRRAPLSGLLQAMLLTDLYILLDKITFKLLNLYQ
jgi:hypothetical protein